MSAVTYQFLKNMADKLLVRAPAIRNLIKTAYHTPAIKKSLTRLPLFRNLYHAVERRDCFDKFYGIDTSGVVCGDILDASPAFTRWYAELIPKDRTDHPPSGHDPIVVWQSVSGAIPTPHPRVNRRIVVVDPLWKSDLEA
jgi:hypothetical protein